MQEKSSNYSNGLTDLSTIYADGLAVEPIAESTEVKVIPASDAITLKGHTADVFVCSWNPAAPTLLASG